MIKKKIKIMFVDDEKINIELFKSVFSKIYDIEYYTNPQEAVERLKKLSSLDILFTDYIMPDINGEELVKITKRKFPNTLTILSSAYVSEFEKCTADYKLEKPWRLEQIKKIIKDELFQIYIK
jgi:CheY-like chemotaxis protein